MRLLIIKEKLINIIKEYFVSKNPEGLKNFFQDFGKLAAINKEFYNFLQEYIPAEVKKNFIQYNTNYGLLNFISDNYASVKKLLDLILDENILNQNDLDYLLKRFAIEGNKEIVDRLLKLNANPKKTVITFHYSIFDHFNMRKIELKPVNILLHGFDDNIALEVLWSDAMYQRDLDVLKILLKHGVDVNKYGPSGWTPLITAIQYEKISLIKLLIDNGADINLPAKNGNTPFSKILDDIILSERALVD